MIYLIEKDLSCTEWLSNISISEVITNLELILLRWKIALPIIFGLISRRDMRSSAIGQLDVLTWLIITDNISHLKCVQIPAQKSTLDIGVITRDGTINTGVA